MKAQDLCFSSALLSLLARPALAGYLQVCRSDGRTTYSNVPTTKVPKAVLDPVNLAPATKAASGHGNTQQLSEG
jgi:hypothetical protein